MLPYVGDRKTNMLSTTSSLIGKRFGAFEGEQSVQRVRNELADKEKVGWEQNMLPYIYWKPQNKHAVCRMLVVIRTPLALEREKVPKNSVDYYYIASAARSSLAARTAGAGGRGYRGCVRARGQT